MKLKISEIQQLDYILKLFPVFHELAMKMDTSPKFQLVFELNHQFATGDFVQFASENGTEVIFYDPGKTTIREIDWERITPLKLARESLQKKTNINSFESRDFFPYKKLLDNPDVLFLFLLEIVKDIKIQNENHGFILPKVVKNVVSENSNYSFILLDDIEYDVIGLKQA
ncbi:hypothetical protein AB6883_12850 [Carnobacterium maltaromaticum]|uniref:hypothetical protein n=1 Tax=Carnobacterium maltaromaticum TaxID=2751 RepID=UPI0028901136|nr:hypothetical protein [Carnobacterium maltaromaticum]MDT1943353.1 hypothetical protein [Carnobacterium maltaromaticum]MDT1998733.1 hypothetical protein [Carnobacterium maltaromaticum]